MNVPRQSQYAWIHHPNPNHESVRSGRNSLYIYTSDRHDRTPKPCRYPFHHHSQCTHQISIQQWRSHWRYDHDRPRRIRSDESMVGPVLQSRERMSQSLWMFLPKSLVRYDTRYSCWTYILPLEYWYVIFQHDRSMYNVACDVW